MNDEFDNRRTDKEMLARTAHQAVYAPEGDVYRVTCPHGCALGTSRYQDDEKSARRRVELHRLATGPLGPQGR